MRRLVAVLVAFAVVTAGAVAASKATVAVRSTSLGKVLVGANGHTLYLFTADRGRTSACYGKCAAFWPPLLASSPAAGPGVRTSLLGTTRRRDGKLQVTYAGHPLYYFVQDKRAGQTAGEGFVHFGGSWWVVAPSGSPVKAKAPAATTPTATTPTTTTSPYGP